MPTGLSIPLAVSKGGGAKKEPEETQLDKLVILSLQEGSDDNPFQDLGISSKFIYRINDDAAKFDAKDAITEALKSFEGRLQLSDDGVKISGDVNTIQSEEGQLHVSFEFINLETNDAKEFAAPFIELGD